MAKTPEKAQKAQTPKSTQSKKRSFSAYAAILAALVLAVAIVLDLMASRLNVVWDMTPSRLYELSDTTKSYLQSLDKKVEIYFLIDMDVLSTDTSSMALYHAMEEYASFDNVELIDFEPDDDPETTKKLQSEGYSLSRGDIVVSCEGRTKHVPGRVMYENKYETDEAGNTTQYAAYFAGENYITGAIDAVVSGRDTVIYFLNGHGEKLPENDYTRLVTNLANRNYSVDTLTLATADAVPDDAAIVIAAAPQSDLSNDETRKINEYLDRGGNVCFWMSPNEAAVRYTNIESILSDLSIGMDYDRVAETDTSLHISGDPYTFKCSVVANEDDEIGLTKELVEYTDAGIIPFMSNTRSFYQLIGSTSDSSVTVGSMLQTVGTVDALGGDTSTAVGEICGGTDAEAKDIQGQVLDLAMYATSRQRNGAKLMVMGNAEFIDDENVAQDYMIIPVNMMLATISWMYDSDLDLDMGIADKERTYDALLLNSEQAANRTNIIFVAVPLCVALVGVVVWLKRRYS